MSESAAASGDTRLAPSDARGPEQPRGLRQRIEVISPILQAALAVTLVVSLALSAGLALTVANVDRTLQAIVDARFEYIANELKSDIEKGLDLGLALKEFSNAQQIIDQKLARNSDLTGVTIANPNGQTLFSATKQARAVPADRRRKVTAPLVNPFGRDAGTVTVVYATGGALDAVRELAVQLSRATALIAGIAAASAALACVAIMRRIPRSLLRAQAALGQRTPPATPNDQIEETSAQAVAVSKATLDDLGAILVEGPSDNKGGSR